MNVFLSIVSELNEALIPYLSEGAEGIPLTLSKVVLPWNWLLTALAEQLRNSPSGFSYAVLLNDLRAKWIEVGLEWNRRSRKYSSIESIYEDSSLALDSCFELKIIAIKRLPKSRETFLVSLINGNENNSDVAVTPNSERKCVDWLADATFISFITRFPEVLPLGIFSCDGCGADCIAICSCFKADGNGMIVEKKCTHQHCTVLRKIRLNQCKFYTPIKEPHLCLMPSKFLLVLEYSDIPWVKKNFPFPEPNLVNISLSDLSTCNFSSKVVEIGKVTNKHQILRLFNESNDVGINFHLLNKFGTLMKVDSRVRKSADEVNTSKLIKVGDILSVSHPEISSSFSSKDPTFGAGNNTVISIYPRESSASKNTRSSWLYAQALDNDDNTFDCSYVRERITITDLVPGLVNVTLLARVESVIKIEEGGESKAVILLKDETGLVDVHTEGTDKILSQYGEGQLVIVEGLRTEPIDQTSVTAEQNPISVAHVQQLIATSGTNREAQVRFKRKRESLGEKEENVHVQQKRKVEGVPMKAFLNLSLAKYGNITVLSSLKGVLTSSCLFPRMEFLTKPFIQGNHVDFNVIWVLEQNLDETTNGSTLMTKRSQISAFGNPDINKIIVGISAALLGDPSHISESEKQELFSLTRGKEFVAFISKIRQKNNVEFQIQQISEINPFVEHHLAEQTKYKNTKLSGP